MLEIPEGNRRHDRNSGTSEARGGVLLIQRTLLPLASVCLLVVFEGLSGNEETVAKLVISTTTGNTSKIRLKIMFQELVCFSHRFCFLIVFMISWNHKCFLEMVKWLLMNFINVS